VRQLAKPELVRLLSVSEVSEFDMMKERIRKEEALLRLSPRLKPKAVEVDRHDIYL
jgi:hypothetical protein